MRKICSVPELVEHMKYKGIKFTITSEEEAKDFLSNNNYYMKLAAYRNNYEKQKEECQTKGQYINLEFAYLQELSIIDMRLRYIILDMCLDIEHAIKVMLVNRVQQQPEDDGYELVRRFVTHNDKILKKIYGHKSSEYSKALIEKYYPYFSVWVFVELISFGDLTYLCDYYSKMYDDEIIDNKFLNIVRDLRNASAHSNCLINKLQDETKENVDKRILDFIKQMDCCGRTSVKNNLSKRFVYDFVVLLYVYDNVVISKNMKKNRYKELDDFISFRVCKNAEYFKKNNLIVGQYRFVKKIVDIISTN